MADVMEVAAAFKSQGFEFGEGDDVARAENLLGELRDSKVSPASSECIKTHHMTVQSTPGGPLRNEIYQKGLEI